MIQVTLAVTKLARFITRHLETGKLSLHSQKNKRNKHTNTLDNTDE